MVNHPERLIFVVVVVVGFWVYFVVVFVAFCLFLFGGWRWVFVLFCFVSVGGWVDGCL